MCGRSSAVLTGVYLSCEVRYCTVLKTDGSLVARKGRGESVELGWKQWKRRGQPASYGFSTRPEIEEWSAPGDRRALGVDNGNGRGCAVLRLHGARAGANKEQCGHDAGTRSRSRNTKKVAGAPTSALPAPSPNPKRASRAGIGPGCDEALPGAKRPPTPAIPSTYAIDP
jgi:hypothetical protein